MKEPHLAGAAELRDAYAARQLAPGDVVRHLLRRIERMEPKIHAFTVLDAEGALKAAAEADAEIAAGRHRGQLHGVPYALKDVIDAAGLQTTCHSRLTDGRAAERDATVVAKLRAQGAILLGKLSTFEFALGGPCFDLPWPPARNPWNTDHHPGGSSSGSGAGLAAAFFPLSIGTDTGGSTRNPASACGVVGLKPTYGLLSRNGVFPLAFSLDHVGTMGRSVEDVALLTQATAGHDPSDPGSATVEPDDLIADLSMGVAGLRIGYVRHFHEADMVADPEVAAALDAAVRRLESAGAIVHDVRLPPLGHFVAVTRIIMQSEAYAVHRDWLRERPGEYGQVTRANLLAGAFLSAGDYVEAQRQRRGLVVALNRAFNGFDCLLCASSMEPAARIDDAAEVARSYPRHARMPANLGGHPAIAMMSGLSSKGLPLSIQFIAPHFQERLLLRVAACFERLSGGPAFPDLAIA